MHICPSPPVHTALPVPVLNQIASFRGQAIKDRLANPNNNVNDNLFRSRRKRILYPALRGASEYVDPANIELLIVEGRLHGLRSVEEYVSRVTGTVERFVLSRFAVVDERASSVLAPLMGVAETQGYFVFNEEASFEATCADASRPFFEAVAGGFEVFGGPVLGVVRIDASGGPEAVSSDALLAHLARKRSRPTVTVVVAEGGLGVAIPLSLLSLWPKAVRASLEANRDRLITLHDVANTLCAVAGSSVLAAVGYSFLATIPERTCEAALVPLERCSDPLIRWGPSDDPVALFEAEAVAQELKKVPGAAADDWMISEASLAHRPGDSRETARVKFKVLNPSRTCFGRLEAGVVKEKGCLLDTP